MNRSWLCMPGVFALLLTASGALAAEGCDQNADQQVDASEAVACAKMDWAEISGGADKISASEYGMVEENLPPVEEVDGDGDMLITEQEWEDFTQASFEQATEGSGGMMDAAAHQTWREEGMRP